MSKTVLSIQSHVAYGYAGNRAATFPLQRLGFDVIALNTVQFSNHTGYGEWTGCVHSPDHVRDVLKGIHNRISKVDAILSGYLGDPGMGEIIIDTLKQFNCDLWLCDPVIGDVGRGVFVRDGISEFFKNRAIHHAKIMTPNQFELCELTGIHIDHLKDAVAACKKLHDAGVETVLVTSLVYQGMEEDNIAILASSATGSLHLVETPKLDIHPLPNGGGDMTAALFLGHILKGTSTKKALELTASSAYDVFELTKKQKTRELALIDAQDSYVKPKRIFQAMSL